MPDDAIDLDVQSIADDIERRLDQLLMANHPDAGVVERAERSLTRYVADRIATEQRQMVRQAELVAHGLRGKGSADVEAIWVAVGDAGTCDSCDERNGEEDTMRTWNVRGIPGSPNLLCGARCRCELIPSAWVSGEEDE